MTIRTANIHTLAYRARDMQPGERQAFVKQHCHDDVALISRVYELMDSASSSHIADDAEVIGNEHEPGWQPNVLIGTRLGAYELTQIIGTGGMGAVFLARRIDDEFQQQVAIKLVRGSLLSANIAARLRAERQILASLQHPNIAMLLDGGTAADGTPYLVMEYIDGQPIDVHCDREALSVEQRLRMFLKICSAVQCAHQSLIVHRDLKPTNILVNHEGQPKLLDFGIAKLLDTELQARHANLTQHDMRLLTPAHASPEQILGEAITTSSDIYVLGVLLYELLCGYRPFVFPQSFRLVDLEHIICSARATPPSAMVHRLDRESPGFMRDIARCRNTTTAKLKRTLHGDLDNIVMMAMRREPARRYASVEQLSNDIKHWLDGLPVTATRDSWRYRASKFIKRYAWAIGGLSVGVATLVVLIIVLLVQAHRTAMQRDAIERERNRAEEVSSFLLDLFRYADPTRTRGNELKARDVLDAGARQIDTALDSQPELRATMLDTIGQVYGNLGLDDDAVKSLEKSLDTRIAIEGENNLDVAGVLQHLGDVKAAQGADKQAIAILNRALNIQQQLLGTDAVEQASTLQLRARAMMDLGDFSAAESDLLKALSLYDLHGQSTTVQKAMALSTLGELRSDQYRDEEAETLMRAALADLLPVLGPDHPQITELKLNLADSLESQGKYREAQPIFEAALAQKRRVLGPDHPQTIEAMENYGSFLTRKGDYAQAQQVLDEVLKTNIRLHGAHHAFVGYDRVNVGILYFMRGDYRHAEQQYREALAIYAHALPPDHVYVAGAQMSLGRLLTLENRLDEAIELLQKSQQLFIKTFGADNPMSYRATAALGVALVKAHRGDEAKPLLLTARPYMERFEKTQELYREFETALAKVAH
ncbi:MAG: serine/threonine-protein kinase [Steroidobacter sp.]